MMQAWHFYGEWGMTIVMIIAEALVIGEYIKEHILGKETL